MTTLTESRKFEDHLTSCGTSPGGAQWVKSAVDPFHDIDLDVIGMPDSTSGRSVVYAVTENLTIERPAGIAVGNSWDCHVAFTPTIAQAQLQPFPASKDAAGNYIPGSVHYDKQGVDPHSFRESTFLTASSVPSGESTFWHPQMGALPSTLTHEYQGLGMNQFLDTDGSSIVRVTGCAFEVHNTTEAVYQSGSVTAYKIARESDNINLGANQAANGLTYDIVPATVTNGPPTTSAIAKLYNGHTWDAKDGCLIPGVLDAGESDGEKMLPRVHVVKTVEQDGEVAYWAPSFYKDNGSQALMLGVIPRSSDGTVNGNYTPVIERHSPPTVVPEMMTSGAYFTGLSSQTKLTLTLRVFVEVFPSAGNALVPLAHPSNPYDAKALQCYQEIMSHMRSGYRVDDNDFGDFFRKAIAVARTVGKTLMPILPPGIRDMVKTADSVASKAENALTKVAKVEATVKKAIQDGRMVSQQVNNRARTKGKALP